jgi:uncharacterized protein YxjI
METFEVSQVVMTVGSTYQVRSPGTEKVLMTVKGSLMSPTPKFQLVVLTGNFIKTKLHLKGPEKQELGSLSFPAIAFKKTLVLTVGTRGFTADGGLMGNVFRCVDNDGKVGIEISKKTETFRDRFTVAVHDGISKEVAILASVAIHSRFFEYV